LTKKQEETEMKKQNKKHAGSKLSELAHYGVAGNKEQRRKAFHELFPTSESIVTAKTAKEFSYLLQIAKCGKTAKWLGSYAEGKVKSLTLKKVDGKEVDRKAEVVKVVGQFNNDAKSVGCFGNSGEPQYC
jgi:hypothetical protein